MAQSSVEKPTFLIIHGAWQTPLFYEDLIGHLEFLGYDSTCPHLPSCKETPDSAFRSITLADDAAFIKAEAARLVQAAGKTVFVVLHSYGGIVGDEALTDGLSYLRRRQLGLKGGIIGLYFVSAYLLRVGESWVDRFDGSNASQDPEHRYPRLLVPPESSSLLLNDVPPAQAVYWMSQLVPVPHTIRTSHATRNAHHTIPSTYLILEKDREIHPNLQTSLAQGSDMLIDKYDAGHYMFLSQPEELAARIIESCKNIMHERKFR